MKQALLIIDVQNDYFPNGRFPLVEPSLALNHIKNLIQSFRKNKYPIYFIQHISDPKASFFIPNTDGVLIHPEITPLPTEKVIIKHFPNSFFETTLQLELQKDNITDLIVCGMMTHMCVDTTIRAAKDYGYHVTLIEDSCATKDLVWNNNTIPANIVQQTYNASLQGRFADIYKTDDYIKTIK
jgi:nicotinamidase-related amidase